MPNDNEKKKTIAQVLVMVSKNYLMEEGTLSKKDTMSENFIKNLKKNVPYQKSNKTMPY